MAINQNTGKLKYNFYFLLCIFQMAYNKIYSFYNYKIPLKLKKYITILHTEFIGVTVKVI